MNRLYVLSGSSTSTDAQALLSSTGIRFEVVDVSDRDTLAAIYRDLSIGVLPALWHEDGLIEGLTNIERFVESRSVR